MVIQILLSIIIDDKPEFVKTGERERDILLSKYKDLKAHDLHLQEYLKIFTDPVKHHGDCDEETELFHEAYKKAHIIAMVIRTQKAHGIIEAKKQIVEHLKDEQ